MAWRVLWLMCLLLLPSLRLRAVENVYTGTYNETTPTSSNIPNWTTGWTQPATQPTGYTYTTGWNYVGSVDGSGSQASGVYLGGGWVITCAHVGPGSFTLNGVTYPYVANTVQGFSSTTGTTTYDIIIFKISPAPALPTLPIRQTDPVVNSSKVALLGYGDGGSLTNETWGYDSVNYGVNESTSLFSYTTNDFWIVNNSSSAKYQLESGDSGGGDFIYNSSSAQWELAGLNEAILTSNGSDAGSAFVQLDTYAAQIEAYLQPTAEDTPAMPAWMLLLMGGVLFAVAVPAVVFERK